MRIRETALLQLATDFNTTPEALRSGRNIFTQKRPDPAKRPYENGSALLQALCIDGIGVFCCGDRALLPVLRENYREAYCAWLMEAEGLRRLDGLLAPFGARICSYHQYYLPGGHMPEPPEPEGVVWLEDAALTPFVGDPRFDEALGGNAAWPDRIAAVLYREGEPVAMAAASQDAARLWQVGINVEPAYRGLGLGTALTAALKRRLLEMDIVPFYGTGAAHTVSQRVAVGAGFVPAWAELYTESAPGE